LAVVGWGERRYPVEEDRLEELLAFDEDPTGVPGVYLRLGDEGRPLSGRPVVRSDLR